MIDFKMQFYEIDFFSNIYPKNDSTNAKLFTNLEIYFNMLFYAICSLLTYWNVNTKRIAIKRVFRFHLKPIRVQSTKV